MPRINPPLVSDLPYAISARTNDGQFFSLPMNTVWSVYEDYLFLASKMFGLKIYAFVLMSNHFHLVCSFPNSNHADCLRYFLRETSKEIGRISGRSNHLYGSRNYKCLLDSYLYLINTYKYVYQNPVRAKVSPNVESYPYSTLHGLLGFSKLIIPVENDLLLNENLEDHLKWLNLLPSQNHLEDFRRALRRRIFSLSRGIDKKTHSLNIDRL